MLGIPEWSIGVGVIILFGAVGVALLVRLLHREAERPNRKELRRRNWREYGDALDDIQRRLAALEEAQGRLGDVEERLDFAERLLAQQRDAERLAPPKR